MGFVSRSRIGTRLAMGFGLMLLLIAGMIVSSYGALQRIGAENSHLIDQELVKVSAVAVIDTTTRANGLNTTELLPVEPAQLSGIQARMQQNRLAIDEARQLVHKEALPALGRLQQPIDTLRQLQDTLAQQHGAAVTAGIASARNLMLVLGGAALVLGLLASALLARSIVPPLGNGVVVANRIAAGDLTQTLETSGKDEVADLLCAIGTMQAGLRQLVAQVHRGVEQSAVAMEELTSASHQRRQRPGSPHAGGERLDRGRGRRRDGGLGGAHHAQHRRVVAAHR